MTGTDQHGIYVLVHLQMFLVECNFAVGGLGLSKSPNSGKAIRAQISQHMLDAV